MVIDTEQRDMNAPYVPDGAREFQEGDKVRFVLGERIDSPCPSCGKSSWEHDQQWVEYNGQTFVIREAWPLSARTACNDCTVIDLNGWMKGKNISLSVIIPTEPNVQGFMVYPNELTLVEEAS